MPSKVGELFEKKSTEISLLLSKAYETRVSDLKQATELAHQALILSRQLASQTLIAQSLSNLALFYMISGQYKTSIQMAEEAIDYYEKLGDEKGIADAKYSIGGTYYKSDNFHLGLVYLSDCLISYRKLDDHYNQARVLKSLGAVYEYFGDQKNAITAYEEGIEQASQVNDLNIISNIYNPLSGIYLKQGNVKEAADLIQKSIDMKTKTGDIRGLGFAYYGRGKVFIKTGDFELALADFEKALEIHQQAQDNVGITMTLNKLGLLYLEQRKFDKAKDYLAQSLEISGRYNIMLSRFKCYNLLYKVYKEENNKEKSLEYLERYLKEREAVINTHTSKVIESYELLTRTKTLEREAQMQKEKAEIIEKKNRAEESAKVKQDFLSTMSHEIRTPLNAVITISSLLKERSNEEEAQLLKSLKLAANNLLLIINDILDFTKLETGKITLENRPIKIKSLINGIIHTYETLAIEKGLQLKAQFSDGIEDSYEMDDIKLSQVLGNIISNAIKYTEKGGVSLQLEKLAGDTTHDSILFKVKDTGVGIPAESYDEIFESFSQPKTITTRKHGGSGLGLAIVKKLVELHNSTISVESKVGQGSEFSFVLHLKKSGPPLKVTVNHSYELQNKTALLAEDNMINAMVASKLLANWGVSTVFAKNGVEAVSKAAEQKYDFILMDIHMPEMDGFDATKHIRVHENLNSSTPIFALTADITASNREDFAPYFNSFLTKPIEIEKLYAALVNA